MKDQSPIQNGIIPANHGSVDCDYVCLLPIRRKWARCCGGCRLEVPLHSEGTFFWTWHNDRKQRIDLQGYDSTLNAIRWTRREFIPYIVPAAPVSRSTRKALEVRGCKVNHTDMSRHLASTDESGGAVAVVKPGANSWKPGGSGGSSRPQSQSLVGPRSSDWRKLISAIKKGSQRDISSEREVDTDHWPPHGVHFDSVEVIYITTLSKTFRSCRTHVQACRCHSLCYEQCWVCVNSAYCTFWYFDWGLWLAHHTSLPSPQSDLV